MNKKVKAMLTAMCALLLVVVSVVGTMAYLQDQESVTNTFTVGDVQIELDEAVVDKDGKPTGGRTTNPTLKPEESGYVPEGNSYKLIPGKTYTKDPTVTVEKGSEECYVRMIVTITDLEDVKNAFGKDDTTDYFLPQNFVTNWDSDLWITKGCVENTEKTEATYEFWYKDKVDALNKEVELKPLFDGFKVPETVTAEQLAELDGMEIKVEAHAIQAEGFDDPAAAWAAFTK